MGKQLRRIGDPVVAAGPAGVRVRTRLHLTEEEAATLSEVGMFLGSVYRRELAHRITLGRMDRKQHGRWRAERKQAITVVASSRWAGAITRTVEDQYQLGRRALTAEVTDVRTAIGVLEQRCALRPGEVAAPADVVGGPRRHSRRPVRGYASAAQRFSTTRRLAALRSRLVDAQTALHAGRASITVGGNRLWRTRQHLDGQDLLGAAEMSEQHWRDRWDAARMFLVADGETGKTGGNETIRVDESGHLRVKVPAALVDRFGTHLHIVAPVVFSHRCQEWADRVAGRRALRYDITFNPAKGRWYLDASWTTTPGPAPTLEELRGGPVLGVDLNADHLAACILDDSGNPVGGPLTIPVETAGLRATRRDGRVRAAITALLDVAVHHNCSAVAVENLNFADARAAGRETMGSGQRGKRLRRTIAGLPSRRFRARLISMATSRGIGVIGVDPAYTRMWGGQHWRKPLQQQTSDPAAVTVHHGAAAAIGRRGLGTPIRRRPAGPRTQQRMRASTPPARPDQPPTPHDGAVVLVHRHAHNDDEARRSTRQHAPSAANTVRVAQASLLLTNQER